MEGGELVMIVGDVSWSLAWSSQPTCLSLTVCVRVRVCVCMCQVEGAELVMTGKRHAGSGVAVEERHRILQLLLSQKRVISLLQERAFPQKSVLASYGGPKKLASGDMSAAEADALLANYSGDFNVTLSDADKQGMPHTTCHALIPSPYYPHKQGCTRLVMGIGDGEDVEL